MNRKAQIDYPQPSYMSVHPILIVGIFIVVMPFILPVIGLKIGQTISDIFYFIGIIIILIGGFLSIVKTFG